MFNHQTKLLWLCFYIHAVGYIPKFVFFENEFTVTKCSVIFSFFKLQLQLQI